MSGLSLALVLAAAFLHAGWNLLAKRAGDGGVAFVWLCAGVATALYLPAGIIAAVVSDTELGPRTLLFLVGSGTIHAAYFTLLQHGYRVGDLSVVYPLARGTGPMLSTAAAIAFLGERPTALALAGAAAISGGVFILGRATSRDDRGDARAGVAFGLLTGVLIAGYTLWDRHIVAELAVAPLVLDVAANATRTVVLAPFAWRSGRARKVWTAYRREILAVAAFSPLAYILVLTALAVSPVSYVAPAREVSILIGTVFGVRLLREGSAGARLAGAAAIVGGLVALALG